MQDRARATPTIETEAPRLNVRSIGDLEGLANVILASAKIVKSFLLDNSVPAPSFSVDAPSSFPDCPHGVQEVRSRLLDAAKKIHQLALGPIDHLFDYACSYNIGNAFRWICHYDVPSFVPLDGDISYPDLAAKIDANQDVTQRMLRYLMTSNIFHEPRPGFIAHTAGSKLMTVPGPRDLVYFSTLECVPWAASYVETFNSTVVDVGGSRGTVSYTIAKAFPNPKFIVQDLPEIVSGAQDQVGLEKSIASRVSFLPHDFFTLQPVKNAEVYFLRMILHNYSDKYAVKILHQLMPAMKTGPGGSKLLIADQIMQPMLGSTSWDSSGSGSTNIPPGDESWMRFLDLQMLIMLNAKERELGDWKALFKRASEGREEGTLEVTGHRKPEGSVHSVIVVELFPRSIE